MSIDLITWVSFFGGLILLFVGGEVLVRGSVAVAKKFGVSPLLIGATVVAFGTSMPELVVSVGAAARGVVDIAIGNVLGSNLANLLLILGVTATLFPVVVERQVVSRDGFALALATIVVVGLAFVGIIPRYVGALMILTLIIFVLYGYWSERKKYIVSSENLSELHSNENYRIFKKQQGWHSYAFILTGILGVVFGAHFLVESGTTMARAAGISEAVIGLTIVALGTSLPELATSIIAALKRQGEVALGNVLGSSLFNIFGILGAVALVSPAPIPEEIINFDIWVLLGVTSLVLLIVLFGRKLGRVTGVLLLIFYAVYVVYHYA